MSTFRVVVNGEFFIEAPDSKLAKAFVRASIDDEQFTLDDCEIYIEEINKYEIN